jgi:FO synthase
VAEALGEIASDGVLDEAGVVVLLSARGSDVARICEAADALRRQMNGDIVSYAVNRNINYTNICTFGCRFCAFSKGGARSSRGAAYDLDLDEVARRAAEAWDRGATEVCMQGGIHPDYSGETYIALCRAVKAAVPKMHIHAFSPLEVTHGAETLGLSVPHYLEKLREAGLGTLPGTAAEILDDEVRRIICPDKLDTVQWLAVVEAAHNLGLPTTATIMFGHVERAEHVARHLLRIRALQQRTGGFTEFVPLPFVHMEAPIALRGQSRSGPSFREALLMHAVARLSLHPLIPNIQASWTKLGAEGVRRCLAAGVNDLGGTLMNESISRAAGAAFGQEMPPAAMEDLIRSAGRTPRQRTTLYADVPVERHAAGLVARPLEPVVQTRPTRRPRPRKVDSRLLEHQE